MIFMVPSNPNHSMILLPNVLLFPTGLAVAERKLQCQYLGAAEAVDVSSHRTFA